MTIEEINLILQNHAQEFNLINLTEEFCRKKLEEESKNSQSKWSEYNLADLVIKFSEQQLVFNHYLRKTPHIRTRIGIYIKDPDRYIMDLEPLGFYQIDTIENGEIIDDWLVYENNKAQE